MRYIINKIDEIAKYLRCNNVKEILKKRLLYPQTRWFYIVDTISFIRRNHELINSIRAEDWESNNAPFEGEEQGEYLLRTESESAIPDFIKDLYVIFKPLKSCFFMF